MNKIKRRKSIMILNQLKDVYRTSANRISVFLELTSQECREDE